MRGRKSRRNATASDFEPDDEWWDDEIELGYGYAEGISGDGAQESSSGFTPVIWLPDPAGECSAHFVQEPIEAEPERARIGFYYPGRDSE